jgi:hypothetical protein
VNRIHVLRRYNGKTNTTVWPIVSGNIAQSTISTSSLLATALDVLY